MATRRLSRLWHALSRWRRFRDGLPEMCTAEDYRPGPELMARMRAAYALWADRNPWVRRLPMRADVTLFLTFGVPQELWDDMLADYEAWADRWEGAAGA